MVGNIMPGGDAQTHFLDPENNPSPEFPEDAEDDVDGGDSMSL